VAGARFEAAGAAGAPDLVWRRSALGISRGTRTGPARDLFDSTVAESIELSSRQCPSRAIKESPEMNMETTGMIDPAHVANVSAAVAAPTGRLRPAGELQRTHCHLR
jgi:hypothetical protein